MFLGKTQLSQCLSPTRSIELTSRFVPRTFRTQTIRTQAQTFLPNRLVDSYPTNCHIKFFEFLSEKLVKTIKMQRSHVQGICDLIYCIVEFYFTTNCQWSPSFLTIAAIRGMQKYS